MLRACSLCICSSKDANMKHLRALRIKLLVVLISATAVLQAHANNQQTKADPEIFTLGSYLGCFNLARLLYMRGVEGREGKQYNEATIRQCITDCKTQGYTLNFITSDYRCWCSISTPDGGAQLPESACSRAGDKGAAVFYFHEMAATQACRLVQHNLASDNAHSIQNSQSVAFNDISKSLNLIGNSTTETGVTFSDSNMLYGQIEVTALLTGAPGVTTSLSLRSKGRTATERSKSNAVDGIGIQFVNDVPAVPGSVLFTTHVRGNLIYEQLMKPGEYQKRLNLGYYKRANNTRLQYTISWQPSRVTWSMEGVPLVTRKTGQDVKWTDSKGSNYIRAFSAPDRAASIGLSISSNPKRYQTGSLLDCSQSDPPCVSQFSDLKSIVCDQPITTANAQHRSVRGPAWLYVGAFWRSDDDEVTNDEIIYQGSHDSTTSDDADSAYEAYEALSDASSIGSHDDTEVPGSNPGGDMGWFASLGGLKSSRSTVRPAPTAAEAVMPGNYSGFTVMLSPRKKGVAIPIMQPTADTHTAVPTSSFGSSVTTVPRIAGGASTSTSTSSSCTVSVVPYGVCGGPSISSKSCRGRRCTAAPWVTHCCQNGFECTQSSASLWTCEPPVTCQNESQKCDWEVSRGGACGGKGSGCVGCQCRDGAWPGLCCGEGFTCTRRNQWHWSCQ